MCTLNRAWFFFNSLLVLDIIRYPKTGQIQVCLPVWLSFYKDIFRFYVSVDDVSRIKMENYQDNVGKEMKYLYLRKWIPHPLI